jgi:magnesium transporter
MLAAICHSATAGWVRVDDLERLSDLRAEAGNVLWAEADIADLDDAEIALIAAEFSLHELAIEDALNTRQRPKLEGYEGNRFIVFHQLDEIAGQLEATQIACFVGDRYLLTLHSGAARTITEAKERWKQEEGSEDLDHPELLLHTLFDVVVDEYQDIADRLEADMEELEEIALDSPTARIQRQLYSMKQKLSRFRRYVLPASRLFDASAFPDLQRHLPEETQRLFRDIHDHLLRMADQIRNIDDLAQAILDLTQSEQGAQLSEVNRRLSGWAAIFAVETLIAGIYGMNFKLVPEDQTLGGFWFALGLMVVSGLILFWFFRKRGWI